MKNVMRHRTSSSTYENMCTLLRTIQNANTDKVTLFASPREETKEFNADSDGPATNFPLLSALAECRLPTGEAIRIVFDGCFLTAARMPRYGEVKAVLDEAVKTEKVYYCPETVPFTSSLSPNDAVDVMLNKPAPIKLSDLTRPKYFSLLGVLSEESYKY